MSDSLGQRISVFEDLQWKNVLTLVEVLRQYDLHTMQHIEKHYKKRSSHFGQTLAFLIRIGLIRQNRETLQLQEQLSGTHNANFLSIVLDRLILVNTRYSSEIIRYVGKYAHRGDKISYRSNELTRSRESAVRNFLMEMGVITYIRHENCYVVSSEHIFFYIQARQESMRYSPSRVIANVEARNEIGLVVERAVVASEKERVGPLLFHHVEHVALRNAAAGYDILSVEAETPTDTTKRYIEVKAVSPESFQFYWSRNEVEVALLLGPLYYLYLVPVGAGYEICKDRFVIISNPYTDVLGHGDKWIVETDILRCRPVRP